MRSDDFTQRTKRQLAHCVGHICSNPDCQAPTSGPGTETSTLVNVGDAAHITAASPGGPRYNPSLTPEQRRSYENGIWLCVTDARIVDQDETHYSVELLLAWKSQAEERARKDIGKPRVSEIRALTEIPRFVALAKAILAALRTYGDETTMLGLEGPIAQMSDVARALEIPAPLEINTIPYPAGVTPHNPFLRDRFEGTLTIRFPDGSEESGKAAHASGLELLMESRDSAIVSLEQWVIILEQKA